MGCAQSRLDNEESVARCKERRNLMKDAVVARNAFAAGHSGYAMALKNTGAALSDYGHGEVQEAHHQHQLQPQADVSSQPQPPPPPPQFENFPPPPPPPNFTPSPVKRSTSMPENMLNQHRRPFDKVSFTIAEEDEEEKDEEHKQEPKGKANNAESTNTNIKNNLPGSRVPHGGGGDGGTVDGGSQEASRAQQTPPMPEAKSMAWDYFFMVDSMPGSALDLEPGPELEPDEIRNENTTENNVESVGFSEVEPKTPEKPVAEKVEAEEEERIQIEHSKTAPADFRRVVAKGELPSVNLMQVLSEIDDQFLKASECAQEVSKMLEATRLHYHSNFADNRGQIDHSARVMRVITWNRSLKGIPNSEGARDELDSEEYETHATVLDKILAWEKKLYEEVKQGEYMKLEYQKKVAQLQRQKKKGVSAESMEKTKAAVSHLHTRYIVDMQSMDSTVSEVNRLRDEQLYPKLVALVDGMAKMWTSMCTYHDSQLKIVTDLKSLDIAHAPKETTKHHHERTIQLLNVIEGWSSQFEKLVSHKKQYIQGLNSWLKLNLIAIESSLKEKISSPPRPQNPPIQRLLSSWHDCLEKLPDELAKSAISSFAAVIKTIIIHQEEEMKLKEKCEETRKEFFRKSQALDEWNQKHPQQNTTSNEIDGEESIPKEPVSEKQFVVESLRKRLEDEVEAHQKHCLQVREKSLGSLKIRLPEIFRAMSDYAHACSDNYERLSSITQSRNTNAAPS
ncbi:Golgin subfamily A member 4 [Tripterygium wilfordii]|uniref:Golgin subfamily A member 4 n=1 Tax=Tripterygium wilfordii TaxID=458696 RepID=A0A7J7DAD5_TRIWF|nr:protein ALTERED PHOSPHATE STARVATION RESPONSE 1-like [Tripterygium wilfordii]KAF5743254.1 Golgin subfamily A member 4 [Tripterygium wilfordii]